MRIAFIIKYIAQLGGLDRVMSQKMNYLAEHGYDVHLITFEQGNHPVSFPLDSRIEHTDVDVRFFTRKGNLLSRVWQFFQMRRTFRKRIYAKVASIKPDVIVTDTYSYALQDILQHIPGKAIRIIESHIAHASLQKSNDFKGRPLLAKLASLYDWYNARQARRAHFLVTLTQQDADAWQGFKNIRVIPNSLTFKAPGRSTLCNKQVISVGRLHAQKGYDMLIDVWKLVSQRHPDWQLNVYGDGDDRAFLERKTKDLGLADSLHWEHATTDIVSRYLDSSIYVMTSRYEGFGLVLVEAMSCGLPCVSFDCPHGPSDIIRDGEDGILVAPNNIQAMADAICRLIADEELRERMGCRAVTNVQRYSPDSVMKQWESLYNQSLREE